MKKISSSEFKKIINNKINKFVKEGYTKEEAEKRAYCEVSDDFTEKDIYIADSTNLNNVISLNIEGRDDAINIAKSLSKVLKHYSEKLISLAEKTEKNNKIQLNELMEYINEIPNWIKESISDFIYLERETDNLNFLLNFLLREKFKDEF